MKDTEITDLFFERSEQAIKEMQIKYSRLCFKVAAEMLSSKEDREECINEAMLAVWNTIPPKRPDDLMKYLLKILRNQLLKRARYNSALKRSSEETAIEELEEAIPSAESTEAAYDAKAAAESINRFLSGLDKNERILFIRRYWFTASIDDLAVQFGISKHNISVRLHRTREKLKEHLEKEGIFL